MPFSSRPNTLTLTDTNPQTLVAGQPNKSIYVSAFAVTNSSGTQTRLDIRDGASVRFSMALAANGGGFVFKFDPLWGLGTGSDLIVVSSVAVTDVRVNVNFFVS